jgi:hypothetical protein
VADPVKTLTRPSRPLSAAQKKDQRREDIEASESVLAAWLDAGHVQVDQTLSREGAPNNVLFADELPPVQSLAADTLVFCDGRLYRQVDRTWQLESDLCK